MNEERVKALCERYQIVPPDAGALAEFLGGMMHALSVLQDRFELIERVGRSADPDEYIRARTALHHDVTNEFLSLTQP
jgi:hypothetical protein